MKKYKLRNGRKQALFGLTESAATLTAAGITSAANLAGAAQQALATKSAAEKQAEATLQAAKEQANAIATINDNNNRLQTKLIDNSRIENDKFRQQQQNMQMTLQMLAGRENENQRLAGARIQLKNGGSKRRLRDTNGDSLLRGSYNNLPFEITDGGGVIPVGTTREGYDLYEIVGNDHNHYHKTKGGKNKTGVGIKFANGETIEGEGNQNSTQGELMLVTPTDAKFISKHSIKGFNPTKAVLSGMHPMVAFNQQESIKNAYGISDDGKSGDSNNNNTRKLRCGGRHKKFNGGFNQLYKTNLIGSGISAGANLIGAGITNWINNKAANNLSQAYNQAGNVLIDAYGNLQGISPTAIRRSDYRAPHAMATIRSANVNVNPELTLVDRATQRKHSAIKKYSLSGADTLNRLAGSETAAYDARSQIYSKANQLGETIRQANAERLTQVSSDNATRDAQAMAQYNQAYTNLLQYNNEIANERIVGAAQTRADVLTKIAENNYSTRLANANAWTNAITQGLGGIGSTLAANAKMASDLVQSSYGWTPEQQVLYVLENKDINRARTLYNLYKDSTNPKYKQWADQLATIINK